MNASEMDFTAMHAGRTMDRLIAERVMGDGPREVRVRGGTETVTVWQHGLRDDVYDRTQLIAGGRPRCYSADLAATWDVVEKMRDDLWTTLTAGKGMRKGRIAPLYDCAVGLYATEHQPSKQVAFARGSTPMEAVCRAMLLAVDALRAADDTSEAA